MDSNKDEALKCIGIAKVAIDAGNKERALKFIRIAQRLNSNSSIDDLLIACEKMDSSENGNHHDQQSQSKATAARADEAVNKEKNYTEEHVKLIRQVNQNKDYYAILGVEKSCSVEDIRKGYRKLSLKVHPDKNKAPGAEEAFKKVSKAFKCLSEEGSRRQYDQTGHVEEYEHSQQHVRRRRGTATSDFYEDGFDPDEIFRAFFGQTNGFQFHSSRVFRTGGMGTQQRTESNGGQPGFRVLLQLLPFLFILLLTSLPSSDPEYSLQKTYSYQIPRMTQKYEVGFFVKSLDFDRSYPVGSESRAKLEENVIHNYKNLLGRHCHIELQRRQWSRHMPTPHCDRLESFGLT